MSASERIARHQHAGDVLRARSVLLVACTMWLVCGTALDVAMHGTLGTGSLAFVLTVRFATTAFHVAAVAPLFRPRSPRVANALIASVFPVTSLALALIATHMGGLASPYVSAVFVIVMGQTITQPSPWRRGALCALLSMAIYPIGVLLAAGDQLADPRAVATFITFMAVVVAGALVAVWGGHVMWSLRQSVFESRKLGRYRLVRRIGKGGMGEVWRAEDRALGRSVALKILSPEHGRKPSAVARFEREIQATAEVAHPNVVRVHDWGVTDDGVWYYAMDLLEGTDLHSLVRRCGPLPPALALELMLPALDGLGAAHRRGIVHRDVKPANMFVVAPQAEPVRIELLDFGIARNTVDDAELTVAGAVMGTPGFMAPEVMAGAPGGVPGDIYGFAASLYFAVSGTTPRDADLAPVSAVVGGIPAALDDALVAALDADPARRPASAADLASRLAAIGPRWTGSWRIDQNPSHPPPPSDPTIDPDAPATEVAHPKGTCSPGGSLA